MTMTEDTMTIRQMCDAFDVTPRTLRFYEAKELLFPSAKARSACSPTATVRG